MTKTTTGGPWPAVCDSQADHDKAHGFWGVVDSGRKQVACGMVKKAQMHAEYMNT